MSMILILMFGVVTDALSLRNAGCALSLTAEGAIAGPVGEMRSGQVRAGEGISSTSFVLDGDELCDGEGKGCWWTPPTYVLQCDVDQAPERGFEVGCNGTLSHGGQSVFYECETGEKGQYDLYLEHQRQGICGEVTLKADGCRSECPAPVPPAQDLSQPIVPGCPTNLNGPYEFPHLIVPVDQSHPDQALGTSFFGEVSPSITSLFNFDIPTEEKNKTCSLIFLLSSLSNTLEASYSLSGSGRLYFFSLASPVTVGTTWEGQPRKKQDLGVFNVEPGNGYSIASFECPAGEKIAFGISAAGEGTRLECFQHFDPLPVGLYITKC